MESGSLDEPLHRWDAIAEEYDWRTLFLGNGLSINLWPNFGYRTLVEHARLAWTEELLFQGEDTPNFEVVLADIITAIWIAAVCDGVKTPAIDAMERSFRRIQDALIQAIRAPSLSTSGETLTIEESMTLRARTENAGHVGDDDEWS